MKIVLIQPPSGTPSLKVPPLGLGYITAVLKRNRIEAKIIDLNIENSSLSTYLSLENQKSSESHLLLQTLAEHSKLLSNQKVFFPEVLWLWGVLTRA